MKQRGVFTVLLGILAVLMLAACTSSAVQGEGSAMVTQTPQITAGGGEVDLSDYGSMGALNDDDLTLEEMLTYAIQDEYFAHTEYEMILDKFGDVQPFSNIVKSEETHISELLPLFEAYDYDVPEDVSENLVTIPDTYEDALNLCAEAEIYNIEMYDEFLKEELPDDVRIVFENLKKASENHLEAFSK